MKTMKYILAALTVGGMMASCNTDIESLTIQRPLTYDDPVLPEFTRLQRKRSRNSFWMVCAIWSAELCRCSFYGIT